MGVQKNRVQLTGKNLPLGYRQEGKFHDY